MAMFISTQIDKFKRNAQKYRQNKASLTQCDKSGWCCFIVVALYALYSIAYIAYNYPPAPVITENDFDENEANPPNPIQKPTVYQHADHVMQLYAKFMSELEMSRQQTTSSEMKENASFKRTKTVQYLHDYVEAATRDLHRQEYDDARQDGNYHRIECMASFDPRSQRRLHLFSAAVKRWMAHGNGTASLYSQARTALLTKKAQIDKHNDAGLRALKGGHGLFAAQPISALTVIAHYFGDEYMEHEYAAAFAWEVYGARDGHPYRRKWDYYLQVPFNYWSDQRLNLDALNVTVTIDAFFDYDLKDKNAALQQKMKQENDEKHLLAIYINDARNRLHSPNMRMSDYKRKNVEFVYCAVDGILQPFAIATRDIEVDEQLFAYYGPNYG